MKYLGIDWGEAKIGLATGSDETRMASPFLVVSAKGAIGKISEIIKAEGIEAIVLGQPMHMSGEVVTPLGLDKLRKELAQFGLLIWMQDERLSTFQAEKVGRDLGQNKRRDEDDIAAAIILQDFLDKKR